MVPGLDRCRWKQPNTYEHSTKATQESFILFYFIRVYGKTYSSWREAVKVVSEASAYLIACELAVAASCRRRRRRRRRCHLHLIVHLNCEHELALCPQGLILCTRTFSCVDPS